MDGASSGVPADFDFHSIVHTLVRRRAAMLTVFAVFLGLVIVFSVILPKKYLATVTMIAGANGGPNLIQNSAAGDQAVSSIPILNALLSVGGGQSPETYVALLQERPLAQDVINQLGLSVGPRELLSRITVQPVTDTAMLTLTATWSNPQMAARIANTFASVFVDRERDLISGQAGSALDYLNKQMPLAEDNLRAASAELAVYEAAHSLVDVNDQTQGAISTVSSIEAHIAQDQVDQSQAGAQLDSVAGQLASMSSTIEGSITTQKNPVLEQLQNQLTQVEVQLQAALGKYTENHPQVVALREQKAELESLIAKQQVTVAMSNNTIPNPLYQQLNQQAATLRAQIAGDQAQITLLHTQLNGASVALKQLPTESLRLADLKRKASVAESVYNALQQKQSEALISKTTSLSDVAITEPADPSDVVIKPSLRFNILVGSIVSLLLAISSAFLLDFFDNSIKDEKVAQQVGLPILTSIPKITQRSVAALPWLRAMTIESFILLVSALRYASSTPLRTFAITSPMQGDGKSTVALNTAAALAEARPKVLLVDGDLRRPTLHEKLHLPNVSGLTDVLVGTATLASAIQPTKYPGFDFLASGVTPPNPLRLLQSPRLSELLNEMLETYQAVVVDTPALAGMMDALAIASKVDGTLLVAAAGATDLRSARRALYRLEHTENVTLLGLVLNQTEVTRRGGAYNNYYVDGLTALPLSETGNGVVGNGATNGVASDGSASEQPDSVGEAG